MSNSNIPPIDILTDTWQTVINRTNSLITSVSSEIMTANSTMGITGSSISPRNATLFGAFTANTLSISSNTFSVNTSILTLKVKIAANNSLGSPGYVLTSAGPSSNVYWAPPAGTVPPEISPVIARVAAFMTGELVDYRGDKVPNSYRRVIEYRRPKGGGDVNDVVAEKSTNTTAVGYCLRFLAGAAEKYPSLAQSYGPIILRLAGVLIAAQHLDQRKARYGGFALAPKEGAASAYNAAMCGLGLLAAYRVTLDPMYLTACKRAATFLTVLNKPNALYQTLYGVTPIPSYTGWDGFCDQISASDKITITHSTWNLLACKFLKQLYDITGISSYNTLMQATRDWGATGVTGFWDFYAINNPALNADYTSNNWLGGSIAVNDGAWHRRGENVIGNPVGDIVSATSTTATLDIGASANNSYYNGATLKITNGPAKDNSSVITAYNGSTKVATFTAWDNPSKLPDSGDSYSITMLPLRANTIVSGTSTTVTLDAGASSNNSAYVGTAIVINPLLNSKLVAANSTTVTLDSSNNVNGAYNGRFLFLKNSTPKLITSYDGTSKIATLESPFTVTPSAGDKYQVGGAANGGASVITAYNGTTKVANLQYPFPSAVTSGEATVVTSGEPFKIGPNANSIGSDQMEYGIEALYDTGFNLATLKTAYETICSWANADTGTFGSAYDSRICWTPYFRPFAGFYNGESKAYGRQYDVQGVGPLLKFKKDQYPTHYAVSLQKALIIPEVATFVDKDWNTIWSIDYSDQFEFTTVGTGTVKGAVGLGILEAYNA